MTWKIHGHEGAVAYLKEQTQPEKIRHAYLITGPKGVGRRTLAKAFVKALNCQNPPAENDFCDECTPVANRSRSPGGPQQSCAR